MKKILVMGLPGSGKTTFAEELRKQLLAKGRTVAWFNADDVRKMHNDWDFSPEGRIRQAERMKKLANGMMTDYVICDFVAPLKQMRDIFAADFTVWMNTEEQCEYEDTNALFDPPRLDEMTDYVVRVKDISHTVNSFTNILLRNGQPS